MPSGRSLAFCRALLEEDATCRELMRRFIADKPALWHEEIGQG
jgi:hypothetical protein